MEGGSSYSETCDVLSCENVNAGDLSSSLAFRPRGSLARALYRKEKHDEYLSQFDKAEWYKYDLSEVPDTLASKFVQLELDKDTIDFLDQSEKKSDWLLTQIWHTLAKTFLGWFMTQTSINGINEVAFLENEAKDP